MSAIAKSPAFHPLVSSAQKVPIAFSVVPQFIQATDLNEMRQLSGAMNCIILLPAAREDAIVQLLTAHSDSPDGTCANTKIFEVLRNAGAPFQKSRDQNDVVVGDVKVNFSTMEADRRGEPLSLTTLEFKTLRYLVENPRRVISRGELLNEVWGYNNYPTTRTVDNQVAKLRKKLEQDPTRPVHLRTVHGAGYKFLP